MAEATVARPTPPAWPAKGTPEYEERLARMRAGHSARVQKAAQTKQQRPTAPTAEEPDLIDVGEPKAARMAPEPRTEGKGKAKASGRKSAESEWEEAKVRDYLGAFCRWAASHEGHSHWHRDNDELELVTVPLTRCYNRLDKKLREQMQAMSDPAALVFGVVCVFGPSIVQEVRNVSQKPSGPRQRSQQRPVQQQPQSQAQPWAGGDDFPNPSPMATNGQATPTPVPDLSPTGI